MARTLVRLQALGRFAGPLLPPLLLCGLLYLLVHEPLQWWLRGEEIYDEQAMKEWVREARVGIRTLPEMLKYFAESADLNSAQLRAADNNPHLSSVVLFLHEQKREELREMLRALGSPPTKIYTGQLPLFPVIYRLEVVFDDDFKNRYDPRLSFTPIAWDAEIPRHPNQYRELPPYPLLHSGGAAVRAEYHLHAYMQRQFKEREDAVRRLSLTIGGVFIAFVAVIWVFLAQRRERQREQRRQLVEQKVHEAQRRHLQEELRRQEAERKQEEAERRRLEEELRRQQAEHDRQEAERQALELKSQLFHNIGIMAKSYAHNIKNLLVRPNDLLRRCLHDHLAAPEQARMLGEVQQTLGTVTERLQEILQTVQRDPSKFERVRVNLNTLARELYRTWAEQALDKWKMVIDLDLEDANSQAGELAVEGDHSHLQQALENFLFNARDAIAEMRTHLRKQARPELNRQGPLEEGRRQAMIAAAGWKGHVIIRTRRDGNQAVLEVRDNGIGMSEEVRRCCTEPHFSTKRDNALYAGLSAGMGLGLSFVLMTLAHHGATLEIESAPLQGALFRVHFPLAANHR
jgi:signal transduction histidine kinase